MLSTVKIVGNTFIPQVVIKSRKTHFNIHPIINLTRHNFNIWNKSLSRVMQRNLNHKTNALRLASYFKYKTHKKGLKKPLEVHCLNESQCTNMLIHYKIIGSYKYLTTN